jgi:energy-converting hydrogenase A subunit R
MGAQGRRSADIVAAVHPVGGNMKLEALRAIAAGRRVELSEVMYVGDSITDVPPFSAVREAGGIALSFNGNRYALAVAELAAAAADTRPTRELALAFAAGGRAGVLEAARDWPPTSKPLPRVGLLAESRAALVHASAYARSHVRGERVARLG